MISDKIIGLIKWESFPKDTPGGQTVGRAFTGVTLICEEAGFKISVDSGSRSQLRNKEIAFILFELYLMEIKAI